MSLSEMIGRGRQEFVKLADRFLIAGEGEMSDESLYHEFTAKARNGSGIGAAETLRDRIGAGSGLFPRPLAEREAVVEMMERRFPGERDAIIASAEKSVAGRLDLLGFTDLDFGRPVNWHLNPLTHDLSPLVHWSRIDPVAPIGKGDLKLFWEAHRNMHFVTLGQAYWLTGDHRYAEAFVSQSSSWIDANPVGMGVGWAASLDVSFRAVQWLWALSLCADSPAVTREFVARLLKSLIEHGRHIEKYLSHYFSPNTHLTGEALGLFYLGMALPELRRAERWRKTGLRILLGQLPKHILSDGVYFEQSSYYHRYTLDFYAHLVAIIYADGTNGTDGTDGTNGANGANGANGGAMSREEERMLWRKLEEAFDHLMWIGRPDGSWPLIGDDDGGRLIKLAPRPANDFRDTLAIGAAIFRRGDWKHVAGDAPSEMLWLLGAEGVANYDRLQAASPREVSQSFETGGYYVMRDGWDRDSSFALIDCGRHGSETGPGHAHSDALAVELAVRGATWLVDPGAYVYGADPKTRDSFRSTRAHNTATVDGEDQSETSTPFGWKTIANCILIGFDDFGDCVIFEGSHRGYHRLGDPVTHTRSVMMLRKQSAFIVSDNFAALAGHDYAVRYHFAPNCEVYARDNRVEARKPNGESLVINFFAKGHGLSGMKVRVEGGWVSTCYGQRDEAPVAVFEASVVGAAEITTVIVGSAAREIASRHERDEQEWN